MAKTVGFSPGESGYEEEMPEHLLHQAIEYLRHYCLVRGYKQLTLTVGSYREATIWGDDMFGTIRERLDRIQSLAERGMSEWGQHLESQL